jgi:hypothetical protein
MIGITNQLAATDEAHVGAIVGPALIGGVAGALNTAYACNVSALFSTSEADGVMITHGDADGRTLWSWIIQLPTQGENSVSLRFKGIEDPLSSGSTFGDFEARAVTMSGVVLSSFTATFDGINGAAFSADINLSIPSGHQTITLDIVCIADGPNSAIRLDAMHGQLDRLTAPNAPQSITTGTKIDHNGGEFHPSAGAPFAPAGALSAALGNDLIDSIEALIDRPRALIVWSAPNKANGQHPVAFTDYMSFPTLSIVRHAVERETAQIFIRAVNLSPEDRTLIVCACHGSGPFPRGGVAPQSKSIVIPGNTLSPIIKQASIEIPNRSRLGGSVHRYAEIGILSPRDARRYAGFVGDYVEPLMVLGVSIWGPS